MKPISAVAVGFAAASIGENNGIIWALHNPEMGIGLTDREYMLQIKRVVEQADVLICNLKAENLSVDGIVLIHTAHTISTPILAVGYQNITPLMREMVSHRFADFDHLIDHLTTNYRIAK